MKKLFILVLIIFLAACSQENDSYPTNINYQDEMIYWDAVLDATGYEIKIGDALFETSTNQLSTESISAGIHDVQVRTLFGNQASIFSPVTQIDVTRTFDIPQNLRISNNHLVWQAVDDATGYLVEANGMTYETVLPNFYLLDLYEDSYEITVQTIRGHVVSSKSAIYEVNVIFNQPSKIDILDDTLTWNAVSDAVSYIIVIEGIGVYRTSETTYDLSDIAFADDSIFKITIMTEFIFDVSFPSKPVYYQTHTHTNQTIIETFEIPQYEIQPTTIYDIELPSGITSLSLRDYQYGIIDITFEFEESILKLNARNLYERLGFGTHHLKLITNQGTYDFELVLTSNHPHLISSQKVVFRGFSLVYSFNINDAQFQGLLGFGITDDDYEIFNQHLIIKASFINKIKQQNPTMSSAVLEVTFVLDDQTLITWPITILYQ